MNTCHVNISSLITATWKSYFVSVTTQRVNRPVQNNVFLPFFANWHADYFNGLMCSSSCFTKTCLRRWVVIGRLQYNITRKFALYVCIQSQLLPSSLTAVVTLIGIVRVGNKRVDVNSSFEFLSTVPTVQTMTQKNQQETIVRVNMRPSCGRWVALTCEILSIVRYRGLARRVQRSVTWPHWLTTGARSLCSTAIIIAQLRTQPRL